MFDILFITIFATFFAKFLKICNRMGEVKSADGKAAIETAEKLMDLYSFHHKFQTKEYIDKCNQVWSDE